MLQATSEQRSWLRAQLAGLTVDLEQVTPSIWAEQTRYLPASVTALPGYYDFSVTPYLREIVDCLSIDSPVREVAIMKGVQLGMTVGVLENAIGYYIDHVRHAPLMLVTADSELAQLRMESYITPMLQASGLSSRIRSTDETNTRKTGKTDKKIEWEGGGFLIPFGAQNANKLRSISIQVLLRDEIDGWPDVVGKDGDPIKLSTDRTAAYESSRKILDISTPLLKGLSKIAKRFALGDQRHYFVRCLKCEAPQVLRWRRVDDHGVVSGIVWETDGGRLVPDSVRYLCEKCGHPHVNEDKVRLLSPDHGAEWRPTERAIDARLRSYHLSALYSPVSMQTWAACVQKWMEAWDEETGRPLDMGALQVFYNNVLGEPFELRGERVKFAAVSAHRRHAYAFGEIPNRWAEEVCGGPVLLLTCSVDVHKENLAVAVWGWCRDRRVILVDYWRFVGDTEQLDDVETWGRLRKLIESQQYVADDGKKYPLALTLIDSAYRSDDVYRFAAEYATGVYPVRGRGESPKASVVKEFSAFTTTLGTTAYGITVDIYKDRWSTALRRSWDGVTLQPETFFNAPHDITDKQLKELTAETKVERIDTRTKQRIGWEWKRPSGAPNELWDLLVYANAALELVAWNVCIGQLGQPNIYWPEFYELLAKQKPFFTEP